MDTMEYFVNQNADTAMMELVTKMLGFVVTVQLDIMAVDVLRRVLIIVPALYVVRMMASA